MHLFQSIRTFSSPVWPVLLLLLLSLCLISSRTALALEPGEVAVLANAEVSGSVALARKYMAARAIPPGNLILLHTAGTETISRSIYNTSIRKPVLSFLQQRIQEKKRPRIHCIVTVFGMPLKIRAEDKTDTGRHTTRAAVDSELALVLSGDYPLSGWLPNPISQATSLWPEKYSSSATMSSWSAVSTGQTWPRPDV